MIILTCLVIGVASLTQITVFQGGGVCQIVNIFVSLGKKVKLLFSVM
jgi:hypothetical protein